MQVPADCFRTHKCGFRLPNSTQAEMEATEALRSDGRQAFISGKVFRRTTSTHKVRVPAAEQYPNQDGGNGGAVMRWRRSDAMEAQ